MTLDSMAVTMTTDNRTIVDSMTMATVMREMRDVVVVINKVHYLVFWYFVTTFLYKTCSNFEFLDALQYASQDIGVSRESP